ncbi:MAG: hypothetical protein ACOC38_13055, partial [Promethearchaeia archaeon]
PRSLEWDSSRGPGFFLLSSPRVITPGDSEVFHSACHGVVMITHLSFVAAEEMAYYRRGEQPRTLRDLMKLLCGEWGLLLSGTDPPHSFRPRASCQSTSPLA